MNLPVNFPYDPEIVPHLMLGAVAAFDHDLEQTMTGKIEEVVGLIFEKGETIRFINQARSAAYFDIGPTQLEEVAASLQEEKGVLALYHSHPTGNVALSSDDMTVMGGHFQVGIYMPWLVTTINPFARARLHWIDPAYSVIRSFDLDGDRILDWNLTHKQIALSSHA